MSVELKIEEGQNIAAIEIFEGEEGTWVHIVSQGNDGIYHRNPYGKFRSRRGAIRVANLLENSENVSLVEQTRWSQSVAEVMAIALG